MKWQGRRQSSNVRRGGGGFSGGGMPKIGLGGLILILLVSFIFKVNPIDIINGGGTQSSTKSTATSKETKELEDFLSVVLADTEDVWGGIFISKGSKYVEPTLQLYSGAIRSGCGTASNAVGPFYCPNDRTIYIDPEFYYTLKKQFNTTGDFAFAYVLAHEVGHHVQNQLGITEQVFKERQRMTEEEYNKLSVRVELQADYFAGVFAKHVKDKGYLEEGDIEEAINAASAVGDDNIQKKATGEVRPESFTHGTSEQRMKWFKLGYEYTDLEHADTFSAKEL